MSNLRFTWSESGPLATQLTLPFTRASIRALAHGRPISLTLWRSDGSGIRIQSRMHDLGERIEVGVLDFSLVQSLDMGEQVFELPASFSGPIKPAKLVIMEAGVDVESGVVLESIDGQQLIVTAGANPYTLAVKGIVAVPNTFEPEYPLNEYSTFPFA